MDCPEVFLKFKPRNKIHKICDIHELEILFSCSAGDKKWSTGTFLLWCLNSLLLPWEWIWRNKSRNFESIRFSRYKGAPANQKIVWKFGLLWTALSSALSNWYLYSAVFSVIFQGFCFFKWWSIYCVPGWWILKSVLTSKRTFLFFSRCLFWFLYLSKLVSFR